MTIQVQKKPLCPRSSSSHQFQLCLSQMKLQLYCLWESMSNEKAFNCKFVNDDCQPDLPNQGEDFRNSPRTNVLSLLLSSFPFLPSTPLLLLLLQLMRYFVYQKIQNAKLLYWIFIHAIENGNLGPIKEVHGDLPQLLLVLQLGFSFNQCSC